MKDNNHILTILRSAKPNLQKKYPIGDIGLFGSRARGDFHSKSDIDILVEIKGFMGFEFMQLADDLEEILGEKIDLIAKNSLRIKAFNFIAKDLIYA